MEKKNSRTSLFLFVYKTLHDLNFTLAINSYTTNFCEKGCRAPFLFVSMHVSCISILLHIYKGTIRGPQKVAQFEFHKKYDV